MASLWLTKQHSKYSWGSFVKCHVHRLQSTKMEFCRLQIDMLVYGAFAMVTFSEYQASLKLHVVQQIRPV